MTKAFTSCIRFLASLVVALSIVANVNAELTGNLSVDGSFEVYISTDDAVQGTLIASGNDLATVYLINSALTPGQTYYLHIEATGGTPNAAIIGDFSIEDESHVFSNGLSILNTSADWRVSTTGWSDFQLANVYGINGDAPWELRSGVDEEAQWIWSANQQTDSKVYFSTTITPKVVNPDFSANLTVDNRFEFYLSNNDFEQGELIGTGNSFGVFYSFNSELAQGQSYYLHIKGIDTGGPAAFLGEFSINTNKHFFANDSNTLTTNAAHWKVSTTGWGNYTSASSYGEHGVGPWGNRPDIVSDAQWIWTQDNETDDVVYFSTKISPTYQCSEYGTLKSVGLQIDSGGTDGSISNVTEASSVYNAWLAANSPVTGLIADDRYNISLSGSSNINKMDYAGHTQGWYSNSLPFPGLTSTSNLSNILISTTGTVSLKAGDYTIFVRSDDGFSFKLNTVSGDSVAFSKFGRGAASGAANEIRYESNVADTRTGGSFTLSQDSVFELEHIYFNGPGGSFSEVNITDSIISTEVQGDYELFSHGALNSKVNFGCSQPQSQAGQVTLRNTRTEPAFTAVCFDTPFSEVPRVFSIPNTASDDDRLALRVRNVTQTGFEIAQVQSPDRASGTIPEGNESQTVDFLAIVDGTYLLEGGAKMVVGAIDTMASQGFRIVNSSEIVDIQSTQFTVAPAIIHGVQSMNNETTPFPISTPFLASSVSGVTPSQFNLSIERGQTYLNNVTSDETIAYMAVTPDTRGKFSDEFSYESFITNRNIMGANTCRTISFEEPYSAGTPLIFAGQNTRNGGDGGWVKRCSLNSTMVGFNIVEDKDLDSEGAHTTEEVGGLALAGTISNQTCPVQPSSIHHYEIEYNNKGVTCDGSPITIKACANAECSVLSTQQVSLDLLGNGSVISNKTFTGSTTHTINNTAAGTVSLSLANTVVDALNPLVCNGGNDSSCQINFEEAGFRFLYGASQSPVIAPQVSGDNFTDTLQIQAVTNNGGTCEALFSGPKTITMSQENVQPNHSNGLAFTANGSAIAKSPNTSAITLNFDSNSIATIPSPVYLDAGNIRLNATYNHNGALLEGSSNAFWVKPANIALSASSNGIEQNGTNANAQPTHKAGVDFTLTLSALNSLNQITPNYSPGQIQVRLNREAPTGTGTVNGTARLSSVQSRATSTAPQFASIIMEDFIDGVSTYNNARYSEVGIISLAVQDSNYGYSGLTIPSSKTMIGRFIPDHFRQTVAEPGMFNVTCSANIGFSAYVGQMDEQTNSVGAISYLDNPVFAITAHNRQGQVTRNYSSGDYMKLDATDIVVAAPSEDEVATGLNGNKLPITAVMNTGTLSTNNLTVLPAIRALSTGTLHYQLAHSDHFVYPRSANAKVNPFTSNMTFAVTSITDADGVTATQLRSASPTGVNISYGRLMLENSFGPETEDIQQTLQLQHFYNGAFVNAKDNSCVNYQSSKMSLGNISIDPSFTAINAFPSSGSFLLGKSTNIKLQATGEGNQGAMSVFYDTYDWLEYDWDNNGIDDNDPAATVTFGLYRGDDRLFHWREVF